MATYLIKSEKSITRQEGDSADIIVNVPALFPLVGASVRFGVYDNSGIRKIYKSGDAITIEAQKITIPLLPADTKGLPNSLVWEMEVEIAGNVYTIGRGKFIIIKGYMR